MIVGDQAATDQVREAMLAQHNEAVRGLIDVNFKLYVETQFKRPKSP